MSSLSSVLALDRLFPGIFNTSITGARPSGAILDFLTVPVPLVAAPVYVNSVPATYASAPALPQIVSDVFPGATITYLFPLMRGLVATLRPCGTSTLLKLGTTYRSF